VLIPEAVHQEILQGGSQGIGLSAYQEASWFEVLSAAKPADRLLTALLDKGEAAVIQLALEQEVKLVLIDERKGRKIARDVYGLEVIGTARVLVEAKEKGLLESVGEVLQIMRQGGYRIHDAIVQAALRAAGEME
jgi:predicted nucleic acid-binding protein